MKHKKTTSAHSRRRSFWDLYGENLADCNEQELEKEGFRITELPLHRDQETKKRNSHKENPSVLPVQRDEQLPKKDQYPSNRFEFEPKDHKNSQTDYNDFKIETKERPKAPSIVFRLILIGSLLLALILLSVSLWLSSRVFGEPQAEDSFPSDAPHSEQTNTEQKPQKDQATGLEPSDSDSPKALPASEIYAKSIDAVLSILTESETASGIGSGFFISENGYIATAAHVIDGMNQLTVQRSDGQQFSAKLIAKNMLTDLAVLKIEAEHLPFLPFGKSSELFVGDRVFAIGTPASIDYAGSLCSGEISYLNRTVRIPNESDGSLKKSMTLLQTNAPLNPGNSGCPLLNEYGQVIGIVSMKLGNQYDGIGFAIPSDGAIPILQAMVRGEPLTDELLWTVGAPAARLGILGQADEENQRSGVRVVDFDSEEPSNLPRFLQKGDLILRLDTKEVDTPSQLRKVLQEKSPGQTVRITVLRNGQELTFDIILEK